MTNQANLSDVKSRFPEFVRLAEDGETTVVTTNGRPVAQVGPVGWVPGDAVGSGTGWLLVDDNVTVREDTIPTGFASNQEQGADRLLQDWHGGRFESGILWLHQTTAAGVLAVPTARWDGSGHFQFFLWRGFGPILALPAWSDYGGWNNSPETFHAARKAASAFGNSALGLGRRTV